MVKTSDDVMDNHPLERMERLKEISEEKRSTISAKKKEIEELERKKNKDFEELDLKKKKELEELDKKKKELADLENKKTKEIEETEDLIEKSFQDLMRHKRKIIRDEEEEKSKELENIAEEAKPANDGKPNYGRFIEQLHEPERLYDISNRESYSSLTDLRDKAARGEITPQEEEFIGRLRERFEAFKADESADKNNYLKRSMSILDQIDTYHPRA